MSYQRDLINSTIKYVDNPKKAKHSPDWHYETMVLLVCEIERLQWLLQRFEASCGPAQTPLSFRIGTIRYGVELLHGELRADGEASAGITHHQTVLISGEVPPSGRLRVLIHQLHELYLRHHGNLSPDDVISFASEVMTQLNAQGGPSALMSMKAGPPTPRRAVPLPPLRCLGCGKGYRSRRRLERHLQQEHGCTKEEARCDAQERVDARAGCFGPGNDLV